MSHSQRWAFVLQLSRLQDGATTVQRQRMEMYVCRVAGLLQVLACVKAAGKAAPHVDVYGFNWSGKHWMTHQVSDVSMLGQDCGRSSTVMRLLVQVACDHPFVSQAE